MLLFFTNFVSTVKIIPTTKRKHMSTLTIRRKQAFKIGIPYLIYINNQPIGLMRSKEVNIQIPHGTYSLGVYIVLMLWKWHLSIGGERTITVLPGTHKNIRVTDRERWWNILFNIDLCLWIASFFVTLPHPWDLIYHIVSEGFFAIWLIRIWIIRKRYFLLKEE